MPSLPADWERRWGWARQLVHVILALDALTIWRNHSWNFGPEAALPLEGGHVVAPWMTLLAAFVYALPLALPRSRTAAVLSWALLAISLFYFPAIGYGLHSLCLLFLFCFMVATFTGPSPTLWRGLHLLLSMVYFNAAYGKLLTPEWQTGEVVSAILGHHGLPTSGAASWGYLAILLQLVHGYTLFTLRGRKTVLISLMVMHLFAGLALGHYLISMLMIGLNVVILWPHLPVRSGDRP